MSGDESESWCEVSVCVLASVLSGPILISLVDMVCDLDLSGSDFEVSQTCHFPRSVASVSH